jgi:hypothetical protein
MDDTLNLTEAMEKASSTLSSKESEETQQPESAEPEVKEEAQAEPETDDKEGEVEEDTPLDKFDPDKLPAELKPLYKNLMKGFTQGRQKDREELNQLRQELDALRNQAPQEPKKPLSPEEYIQQVAEQTITQKRVEDYKAQALADYNNADPRLNLGGEQYDDVVDMYVATELNKELEKYVQEHGSELGFPHRELTKNYLTKWDQKVQAEVEKYLAKQKKLAKKAELSSGRFNPKSSAASVKPSGNMTLEQAMQAAIAKQK